MGFLKFVSNLFGGKKEQSIATETPVVTEKPAVEKITERLKDVSTKPLTKVETVEEKPASVKDIKSKSTTKKKKEPKPESVETPKKETTKKTSPKKG